MMHNSPPNVTSRSVTARPTLLSLQPGECRWPLGDPRAADFALCGAPAHGRYCPRHAARGRARAQPGGGDSGFAGDLALAGLDAAAAPPPVRFATHMDRWA